MLVRARRGSFTMTCMPRLTRRDLALRFEPVQATAMVGIAAVCEQIGETSVSFGGKGSWTNRAVGLGLTRAPTPGEIDAIDAFFASRGVVPRLELTAFVDPVVLRALASRGYTLATTMELLVLPLDVMNVAAPPALAAEIEVSRVDAADDVALREHCEVASSGFRADGAPLARQELEALVAAARLDGTDLFIARVAGEPVGAGSCRTRSGFVTLFGTSVRPPFRRRGVHRALIDARIHAGRARGGPLAAVISAPGGPTERNAIRRGFELGYARFVLERRAEGLVGLGEA